MDEEPPRIDPDKLDFSQFHPTGDHWPFTAYCRRWYKGGWHHLVLAWRFHYAQDLRAATVCKLGRHRRVRTWRYSDDGVRTMVPACGDCWKDLP